MNMVDTLPRSLGRVVIRLVGRDFPGSMRGVGVLKCPRHHVESLPEGESFLRKKGRTLFGTFLRVKMS